jgi:7-cyano-7-deazaguanine synthase
MKTVALFSGGLDSVVLASYLGTLGDETKLLAIDYGQRHRNELAAAHQVGHQLGMEVKVADISGANWLFGDSALTNNPEPLPLGTPRWPDSRADIFVANRNMLFVSLAASWAMAQQYDAVAIAVHLGDEYPDDQPGFVDAMRGALKVSGYQPLKLHAPFLEMTKTEVVRLGAALGAPLRDSWSCFADGESHCGRCIVCVKRRNSFQEAGILDPTRYAA